MGKPFITSLSIADLRASADIIDEVSDSVIYMGWCLAGTTATDEAMWSILKIETVGTVTTCKWVEGQCFFNQIWDNRALLTYQFKAF